MQEEFEVEQQSREEWAIERIQNWRLKAYAHPITGSDRLFVEAQRMQMMSESGWELIKEQALARYSEIKTEYPWPDGVDNENK